MGWDKIPVHVVDLADSVRGQVHENMVRKNFMVSEIIAIKRALEPEVKAESRQRMLSGKPTPNWRRGETRDIIAKFAGISHGTLQKIEAVVKAASLGTGRSPFSPMRRYSC